MSLQSHKIMRKIEISLLFYEYQRTGTLVKLSKSHDSIIAVLIGSYYDSGENV